jgi:Predicted membrane protein (DUF2142)
VRTGSFVSRLGAVIRGLRLTPHRTWLTSFVLVTALGGLWAIANPPFAAPDEPAHVIRADALVHGQVTGDEPTGRVERELRPVEESSRVVRAPQIYRAVNGPPCFAFEAGTATCLNILGPSRDVDVVTYEALQPPVYYAVTGIVSWVFPAGSGAVYLMRVLNTLVTAALIATAVTALRRTPSRTLVAAGLVVAVTPMVLFIGSAVNPNGPEIAASIALWVCGLALMSEARTRVDNGLVTAVGIAGCVLALSRLLGPLWFTLIALALLAGASRAALRNLARSRWARLWGALVALSAVAQMAWDVIVQPRDATLVDRARSDLTALEATQDAIGSTFQWYREMIGWFGWLDTPAPQLTWLLWTAAIAFFVLVAVAWADRRSVTILLSLLAAVVVVPIVIATTPYRSAGTFWQGRYTLPIAVGVPILAGFALASSERGRQLVTNRFLMTVGVATGVAHFLAFAQNLRRYTVGYDGDFQYWRDAQWLPPVMPPLLLTLAFVAALVAFTAWMLWPDKRHTSVETASGQIDTDRASRRV